ncbi:hypothetical protein O3M35_011419 [Rhynocoris fuscipes]|uniref:Uncharacterized protein n=1 Tax=Rhynocoris fuscipes TaxID=488301 RepID=A0AAW1CYU0_9HEMI
MKFKIACFSKVSDERNFQVSLSYHSFSLDEATLQRRDKKMKTMAAAEILEGGGRLKTLSRKQTGAM